MEFVQYCWKNDDGWQKKPDSADLAGAALVLVFGATVVVEEQSCIEELSQAFPEALMLGCTTGGEIADTTVSDDRLVAVVISFASSRVQGYAVSIHEHGNSEAAAKALAAKFPQDGLRHLFVLADGILTNGSEVVRGLNAVLPDTIPLTGGLAGDGMRFSRAYVVFNGAVQQSAIAAVGFYGEKLRVGYGSCGGWRPFGPQWMITSSVGNTMYEVDGRSVLDFYKQYLGSEAEKLPGSGLLFPLSIITDEEEAVVRTIKSVDEKEKSLSFSGDVPVGSYAQLMRAVPDELIDGAAEAAEITKKGLGKSPTLCILISCVGRRAVLQQLTEEEIEIVRDGFNAATGIIGFYSIGEIAPFQEGQRAILHNQTMTITALTEV
ncbi:MAG: FIST N-terminal domain-containing protein [Desulfopila sp.]|jgi:hypothetical protein|nr:FIST N-terminal domain-containing protein [Desulfopila sp.]